MLSALSVDFIDHAQFHRRSGLSHLSPPTCNQEDPTRCCFRRNVRLECQNMPHKRTDIHICRITATLDAAEVTKRTNEVDGWIATDARRVLGRNSRARRFRSSPLDSRLEEQIRTDQQHPSRDPHPHSGLFERGRERSRPYRTDPRVPDLEGGVRITVFSVDPFSLLGRGENPGLP